MNILNIVKVKILVQLYDCIGLAIMLIANGLEWLRNFEHVVQPLENTFFLRYLFLHPHLTTHHSNVGA